MPLDVLNGEILSPNREAKGVTRVVACPHPFAVSRQEHVIPYGLTIAEIIEVVQPDPILRLHAYVEIEGVPIPRANWRVVRPKPGRLVNIRVVPAGGGGGGKNPLRTVLTIAVLVAGAWAAGQFGPWLANQMFAPTAEAAAAFGASAFHIGVGKAIVGGLVTAVGLLAVNAIAPPPKPRLSDASGRLLDRTSPTLSISGATNRFNKWGPVPRVFGRNKMFPLYGAVPYTEIVGDDQYLRLLFDLGYGPLRLTEHRIGQTPIEQFSGVEMEIREGWPDDPPITLYTNQVFEDGYSIKLTKQEGSRVIQTRDNCDEFSADLSFNGLVEFDSSGNRVSRSVQVQVEYRVAGSNDAWTTVWENNFGFSTGAVSQIGSGVNFREYRTNCRVGGPVTVVLNMTGQWTSGDNLMSAAFRYRVYSRTYGATAWVLRYETKGYPATDSVTIAGETDKQMEIRVELIEATGPAEAGYAKSFNYTGLSDNPYLTFTAATEQIVRRNIRVKTPAPARYEVRFTRLTDDSTNAAIRDECFVTILRTIRYSPPINAQGHCLVALRIKGSDQINGVVQDYNVIAEALLPTWDGASWTEPQLTRSPAWAALEVLRGRGNKMPLPDSRIDLQSFLDFHNTHCAVPDQNGEPMFLYDDVIDVRSTVYEVASDILATARAQLVLVDGKWAVTWDRPQSTVVQVFTPRNSWGFRGKKVFVDQPHALRCRFIDPEKGWSENEVLVYADGFSAANATLYEAVEFKGIKRASQVWREGRYHQGVAKLRPEIYELHAETDHLVCNRGSLVRVNHDVPRWGLTSGRIKDVQHDGNGNVAQIMLDEIVQMSSGKTYAIRVRLKDGSLVYSPIQTVAGETQTLVPVTPIGGNPKPQVDDLVTFGESELDSALLLVKSIQRMTDYTARLELVDYAPALYALGTEPIPDFDTQSTFPEPTVYGRPPRIVVDDIRSDESVLVLQGGRLVPRIAISFHLVSSTGVPADTVQAYIRRKDSGESWKPASSAPISGGSIDIFGVEDLVTYEIRLRSVNSRTGRTSEWTPVIEHKVVGKSTPPANVAMAFLNGSELVWSYPSPARDHLGFKVRHKYGIDPAPSDAIDAHDGYLTENRFDVSSLPGGPRTFFVYAVDDGGRESAEPAIVIADLGNPIVGNVVLTDDYRAKDWPGVIEGGERDDQTASLIAVETSLFWPPSDNTRFWQADSDVFWPSQGFAELVYMFDVTPSFDVLPANLTIDAGISGQSYRIESRHQGRRMFWARDDDRFWPTDDAETFWAEGESDWLPWRGVLTDVGRRKICFRVTVAGGPVRGVISDMKIVYDVEDESEVVTDVDIAPEGTRLPITKSYRQIINVNPTLHEIGTDAVSVQIVDKNPELGPLLKVFNGSKVPTTGRVSAEIQGIKR